MKKHKVVLDTNLWISFLISRNYSFINQLIRQDRVVLLFSRESIQEFMDVVQRPKFQKYFSENDVRQILNLFDEFGELLEVETSVNLCRDSKDNFLLDLCIDGMAQYLITGDKDLLILKKVFNTEILTITDFQEIFK